MGSTTTSTQAPAPQNVQTSMQDYVNSLPALYQAQMQYEPQMQALNLAMLQQYGLPMGQAYQNINEALYPQTSAIQENLAGIANEGMSGQLPQWAQDQYRSEMNANLGNNVGSGIGADYASRGLMQQTQNWQQYYQNLGLSVAGRQPLAQGGTSQQLNYMQGINHNRVLIITHRLTHRGQVPTVLRINLELVSK
jgi:hypothetical protein